MAAVNTLSLRQDRRLRAAVLLAILVHLGILTYLAVYPQGIFSKGDAVDYHFLGENLRHHYVFGFFSQNRGKLPEAQDGTFMLPPPSSGQGRQFSPDPYRTPGYPLFLALIYGLGGTPYTAIVLQSILSLGTLWLMVMMATWLFQQPALGWRVAWLAAVEPLNFIFSHQVMSDSLFTLFFWAALWLYLRLLLTPDLQQPFFSAILGGLLLAGTILIRPVGVYLPLLFAFFALGSWGRFAKYLAKPNFGLNRPAVPKSEGSAAARRWQPLAVFFLVALLAVTPWLMRNYLVFQRVFLSTSADHNLLITLGAQMETSLRFPAGEVSYWEVRHQLETELTAEMARQGLDTGSEVERAAYFREWTIKTVKAHPYLALRHFGKGLVTQFFSDVPSFFELLGFTREQRSGWGALVQQGLKSGLQSYFGPNWPFWVAAAVPLIVYDLGIYLLALIGIFYLCRSGNWFLFLLLVAVIAYFWVVSAVSGLPRYRLPAMPSYIMLAAWGWFSLSVGQFSPDQVGRGSSPPAEAGR